MTKTFFCDATCVGVTKKGNCAFTLETNKFQIDGELFVQFLETYPQIEQILSISIKSKMYKNFFPICSDFWAV